jgi:hypothetical protein
VSSTILMVIVLVVMWLVVLVPMFVRRHDESAETRSMERFATAMRVLARRSRPAGRVHPAGLARGVAGMSHTARSAAAERARAAGRRRMLARRRRTLSALGALLAVGVSGALARSGWWWLLAAAGAMLVASYMIWLRQEVRRERERRRRRAVAFSRTAPSQPPRVLREPRPTRAATGHQHARTGGAAAAPPGAGSTDGTWEPRPVPRPTYVTKPAARQSQSEATGGAVALDDDDPTLGPIEDMVQPIRRSRAANG